MKTRFMKTDNNKTNEPHTFVPNLMQRYEAQINMSFAYFSILSNCLFITPGKI